MKRVYRDKKSASVTWFKVRSTIKPFFKSWRSLIAATLLLFFAFFIVACMVVSAGTRIWPSMSISAEEYESPQGKKAAQPWVEARSAVLIDTVSGNALFEKNAEEKLPMASTTKITTALVVRDQLDLTDMVTVSAAAASTGEQEIWLLPDEKISVEELLWALLVQSANDAATSLAEYTAGSVEAFAQLMNKKAAEAGAVNSSYKNPHGLDMEGHYTTAHDLALLGRELLKDPVLAKMVRCTSHPIPSPEGAPSRMCISTNDLLKKYKYTTGIKTGYTSKSGPCLVASAEKEGKSLVAVVMNSQHRADDVIKMFEYGFNNAEEIKLVDENECSGRVRTSAYPKRYVKAYPEQSVSALTINGSKARFEVSTGIAKESPAGSRKGNKVGTIKCSMNGVEFKRVNILSDRKAKAGGFAEKWLYFIWYALCWMGRILSAPIRIF